MLHGGDNDSTGTIACAWWGALHGFGGVPKYLYEGVEKREEAKNQGIALYNLYQQRESIKQ